KLVEQKVRAGEKAKRPGRKPSTMQGPPDGGSDSQTSASVAGATSLRIASARRTPDVLDARFAKAARKLKTLGEAPAKIGRQQARANGWARIFDETVPDQLEIVEAEAG